MNTVTPEIRAQFEAMESDVLADCIAGMTARTQRPIQCAAGAAEYERMIERIHCAQDIYNARLEAAQDMMDEAFESEAFVTECETIAIDEAHAQMRADQADDETCQMARNIAAFLTGRTGRTFTATDTRIEGDGRAITVTDAGSLCYSVRCGATQFSLAKTNTPAKFAATIARELCLTESAAKPAAKPAPNIMRRRIGGGRNWFYKAATNAGLDTKSEAGIDAMRAALRSFLGIWFESRAELSSYDYQRAARGVERGELTW